MRLLFVVQRYGLEVAGGSEQHCREFAERLVQRGHDVDVVTTCAVSYVDWANIYSAGISDLNGVHVHRLPTAIERDADRFNSVNARVLTGRRPCAVELQREWMRLQGPFTPDLLGWLRRRCASYDCVVFITYLYWTTWAGLREIAGMVPCLLHPTAHDEPSLRLSLFEETVRLPNSLAFLTPEERNLIGGRFPAAPEGSVVGVGVDLGAAAFGGTRRRVRDLGDTRYLCYVGRLDQSKGVSQLLDYFIAYKQRHDDDLRLALVGEPVMDIPGRDDVVVTGFVDRSVRDLVLSEAVALVHPSYYESFSMVLVETFGFSRPALVQGECAVLKGHADRSGGALAYTGYAEFEASVEILLEQPSVADALGRNGRAYVERDYQWPTVLDRYEDLLGATTERWQQESARNTN